jgi:RNA polymerase-binding protein DksA
MSALTKSQTEELQALLRSRQTKLLEEIRDELARSGDQHYIDLAGRVTDLGDESVADMLADLEAAQVDRQVNEVRDVEAALARIKSGEYGVCVDCGENIAFKRLQVYPSAKRCILCQEKREKQYAGEGQHSL